MDAFRKMSQVPTKCVIVIATFVLLVPISTALNLGLIAGDLKRFSSPLIIKKISKHSPVFININSGLTKVKRTATLKKPPKLTPLKPKHEPSKKLPRSILSPQLLPPLIPKLPLIPLFPILPPILSPILAPLFPKYPVLPILPVPKISSLKSLLKPLSVPILGKPKDLKPLKVPLIKTDKKEDLLKKLLDLKIKGSLTTPEYIQFKKLLIK